MALNVDTPGGLTDDEVRPLQRRGAARLVQCPPFCAVQNKKPRSYERGFL